MFRGHYAGRIFFLRQSSGKGLGPCTPFQPVFWHDLYVYPMGKHNSTQNRRSKGARRRQDKVLPLCFTVREAYRKVQSFSWEYTMEYLYGSLEGRCSEAVCHPVRVLEIRIGHVSSFGCLREGAVGSLSLWEMSAEVLFCCFASHSPTLGGVLEKELRVLPLLVSLRKEKPAYAFLRVSGRVSAESRGKGFQGIALKTHHQFFWRLLFFFLWNFAKY